MQLGYPFQYHVLGKFRLGMSVQLDITTDKTAYIYRRSLAMFSVQSATESRL